MYQYSLPFQDLPLHVKDLQLDMYVYSAPFLVQPTNAWAWHATETCKAGWAFHAVGRPGQVLLGFCFEGGMPEIRQHSFKDLMDQYGIPEHVDVSVLAEGEEEVEVLHYLYTHGKTDTSLWPEDVVARLYKRGVIDWVAGKASLTPVTLQKARDLFREIARALSTEL